MTLDQFFKNNSKIALGFSGGVDSSYVLYAALQHDADIKPYFIKTAFQPAFELDDAKRLAQELGAVLTVIETNILQNPMVIKNDEKRCYHCKQAIFGILQDAAAADGYSVLIDGSNASDDPGDRPGMQALTALGVLSPLRECGITKEEIRMLSKEAGLFTWDKPAYACLATRCPTGMKISKENLEKVEKAEDTLFSLGFCDFRVRLLGDAARLQLPEELMEQLLAKRVEILAAFKDFSAVLLDLNPRPYTHAQKDVPAHSPNLP